MSCFSSLVVFALCCCASVYCSFALFFLFCVFFFQAEDGIRDLVRSRGLGDVYKRQAEGILARPVDVGVAQRGIFQPVVVPIGE